MKILIVNNKNQFDLIYNITVFIMTQVYITLIIFVYNSNVYIFSFY